MSDLDLNVPGFHHVGGVWWHEAPLPRRWHRCRAQSTGFISGAGYISRCACGAMSRDGGPWFNRNERRKRAHAWRTGRRPRW